MNTTDLRRQAEQAENTPYKRVDVKSSVLLQLLDEHDRRAEQVAMYANEDYPRVIERLRQQIATLTAENAVLGGRAGDLELSRDISRGNARTWKKEYDELKAQLSAAEPVKMPALREGFQNWGLANIGDIALGFVDRAGDHCEQDPAETICDEFSRAVGEYLNGSCSTAPPQHAAGPTKTRNYCCCGECGTAGYYDSAEPAEQHTARVPEGWRSVPIKSLELLMMYCDPEPMRIPSGEMMVFKNPHAAEVLTKLSAAIRDMLAAPTPPAQEN